MNFISETREHDKAVELKYCERCGGLWLRKRGANGIHCLACEKYRAEFRNLANSAVESLRMRKQLSKTTPSADGARAGVIETLQGLAVAEVRA